MHKLGDNRYSMQDLPEQQANWAPYLHLSRDLPYSLDKARVIYTIKYKSVKNVRARYTFER
jgi:hypothetical protein